ESRDQSEDRKQPRRQLAQDDLARGQQREKHHLPRLLLLLLRDRIRRESGAEQPDQDSLNAHSDVPSIFPGIVSASENEPSGGLKVTPEYEEHYRPAHD